MTERQLTDREIKAPQIAAKSKIVRKGNAWLVPSQAGQGEYGKSLTIYLSCAAPDLTLTSASCVQARLCGPIRDRARANGRRSDRSH